MTTSASPNLSPTDTATTGDARRAGAIAWIASVHDELTALFTRLDRGAEFREDTWTRAEGGGGYSRVMTSKLA